MKRNVVSFRSNVRLARRFWNEPSGMARHCLRDLTARHSLSVGDGHLQFLEGRWYITHAGLLHIAERRRCAGIKTSVSVTFLTLIRIGGSARLLHIKSPAERVLRVTATPIPQMFSL
jgi:hypothetical protein